VNKIVNNYPDSVALDGDPEPDLVHATGCKQPSLTFSLIYSFLDILASD
jgi:hypothetical protein